MADTEPSPAAGAPPLRVLVTLSVLAFLVLATAVAAYITSDPANQQRMLDAVAGSVGTGLLAGVPGLLAWMRGEQTRKTVAKIDRQTNGELDRRIYDGARQAYADHTAGTAAPTGIPEQVTPTRSPRSEIPA